MDTYQVEWKRSAAKELKPLPNAIIRRIVEAVEGLATDPFPHNAIKLIGSEHTYRIRIGDCRVIYSVDSTIRAIEIVRVRHRRDVYQR